MGFDIKDELDCVVDKIEFDKDQVVVLINSFEGNGGYICVV